MNVAIVGSRKYPRIALVGRLVGLLPADAVVVSGGAQGVDSAAVAAAALRGLGTIVYEPDWDRYGRRAGFERNKLIVKAADRVVAFWDGGSSGTAHSIQLARFAGKPLKIYGPDGNRMVIEMKEAADGWRKTT